jgi:hypothetical protein
LGWGFHSVCYHHQLVSYFGLNNNKNEVDEADEI